jgi:tRNA (guanine37-N1)-methyltransferase
MAGAQQPGDELIALGVIRKPHGVRGEASVEVWADRPERFAEIENAFLVSPDSTERCPVRIDAVRAHPPRFLVHFEGIDTPETLRAFQNWTIEIPTSQARTLDTGEYFLHDLAGIRLYDAAERLIGEVTEVAEGGGGILLTVLRPDGGSFDLPFAEEFCPEIDVAERRMRVSLPAGLENPDAADEATGSPDAIAEPDAAPAHEPQPVGTPQLRIDVVTIFPRMFDALLAEGIIAKASQEGILAVRVWDLRDFTSDRHRSTDDEAYGGGVGMVMLPEPLFRCVETIKAAGAEGARPHVVMMSPQGRVFSQAAARELRQRNWVILLCGRYEGLDERVREALVDEEISIGDYVVTGGELPAMVVIDATGRMVEGVVGERNSVEEDSFYNGLLDHPHYTRPAEFRGLNVPEVLLSGNHERIRKWRKEQALRATLAKRPDLLDSATLDEEAREMLVAIRSGDDPGKGKRRGSR